MFTGHDTSRTNKISSRSTAKSPYGSDSTLTQGQLGVWSRLGSTGVGPQQAPAGGCGGLGGGTADEPFQMLLYCVQYRCRFELSEILLK